MLELHRCKICGTRWLLWPAGVGGTNAASWNVLDKYSKPGACCNNVVMGDQIEHLRDLPIQAAEPTQDAVGLIAAERQRQIMKEGWTDSHDDEHDSGEMIAAAITYAERVYVPESFASTLPPSWPWAAKWWKPSTDPVRNLVKAGALIAAEIDRLMRASALPARTTETPSAPTARKE